MSDKTKELLVLAAKAMGYGTYLGRKFVADA